jgi:salicylate hydroxylase
MQRQEPGGVCRAGGQCSDAIHTMTPLPGLGGNTVLVDAALLSRALAGAATRHEDPLAAIGAYESAIREYAIRAVQQSLRVSNAVACTNVAGRLAFCGVLRLATSTPPLKGQLFRRPTVPL